MAMIQCSVGEYLTQKYCEKGLTRMTVNAIILDNRQTEATSVIFAYNKIVKFAI